MIKKINKTFSGREWPVWKFWQKSGLYNFKMSEILNTKIAIFDNFFRGH